MPRLYYPSGRYAPMRRDRVRFLACTLILASSLTVYYYTAGTGKGSRAVALERLRNSASAHAQGPAQVGDNFVDAHEDGGASSIYVSVKTAARNHNSRLVVMMLTWMRTVLDPAQVHIITSGVDHRQKEVVTGAGFILQNTSCTGGHSAPGLWCKTAAEHASFFEEREAGKNRSWFCHFDDDVYVNFPRLVDLLMSYSPTGSERLYIGLQQPERRNQTLRLNNQCLRNFPEHKQRHFKYAAGAVYCISSALMSDMAKYTRNKERFEGTCSNLSRNDDVCVGAIIGALLGTDLTEVGNMLCHTEDMTTIPAQEHKQLITWGYRLTQHNFLRISNPTFSVQEDPTRFLSYHCLLHPEAAWCRDPPHAQNGSQAASALYHRIAAASNLQL